MSDEVNVKDLFVSFFSDRQIKEVEICVDDIVTIYEDDSAEMDDIKAVGELVTRIVEICKDDKLGSLEFCVSAEEELKSVALQIEESAKRMRMMVDFDKQRERSFRRVVRGARERSTLIDFVNVGISDLGGVIKERKFYEGGY